MLDPDCNLPAVFRTVKLDGVVIRSTTVGRLEIESNAFRRGTRNGTAGDGYDGRAGDGILSCTMDQIVSRILGAG